MSPRTTSGDFGRHSGDSGASRPGVPASFYDRLRESLGLEGQTIADLGTGPGTVAIEPTARGARVTGVDVCAEQITEARRAIGRVSTQSSNRCWPRNSRKRRSSSSTAPGA